MKLNTTILGLGALLLTAGAAQAGVSEDFENGNPNVWQSDFNGTFNGFPISAIPGTVVTGGNPGSALSFTGLTGQIGPWYISSENNPDFSGNMRGIGVDGIAIDMNFTSNGSSPFGAVFVAMIADDMGTAEVSDDIFCWKYDFAYAFNGFGPGQLPAGAWNSLTWDLDTSSTTLPAGWTLNNIGNTFVGDVDAAWNALVQDVDYVAFSNGAPWGGFPLGDVDLLVDNIALTTGDIGTSFCFCDGNGTMALCGNAGATGAGCANGGAGSTGAVLSAQGLPSVSGSTVVLTAVDVLPSVSGIFFQGNVNGGNGMLFASDGLLCTSGGILRLQTVPSDATGTAVSSVDLGATAANASHVYQYWYRDPMSSPCGQLSNTTNAVEIVWQP